MSALGRLTAAVPFALAELLRHRLRTALTALGVVIGVGSVIVMVALGRGARQEVETRLSTLGENVVVVVPGSQSSGGVRSGAGTAQSLTAEDAAAVAKECASLVAVSAELKKTLGVVAGNLNWTTEVSGVAPSYPEIRSWPLESGEFWNEQHERAAAKVCVLGASTAEKLFAGEDPLGQFVRVKGVPLEVIGVLTRKGQSVKGKDQDDIVLVPLATQLQRLYKKNRLDAIVATTASRDDLDDAQEEITSLLRQRHKVSKPEDDDFIVRSQEEIASAAAATSRTLGTLLLSVAAVSLVVGGIGIMNVMLISVTERTREIGIRRAVGARSRDILTQFLMEAIVLASLGGLVGVAAGVAASHAVTRWQGWSAALSLPVVAAAFSFAAAVGLVFGFYPAWRASALMPGEALRHE